MSFELVLVEPAASTFNDLEKAAKSAFENRRKTKRKEIEHLELIVYFGVMDLRIVR